MTTILVTGANRGVGFELTRQYADDGCRVIACCRSPDDAENLQRLSEQSEGRVSAHRLDVTDADTVAELASDLSETTIDILINNAGILGGDPNTIFGMDYAGWTDAFATNTIGPFRVIEALIENIKRAETPKIITISSQLGSLNRKGGVSYAYKSSKAAVNKVMQVLAEDLKDEGIIVCPVHPGWVRTDMGGQQADLSPAESASGLRQWIASLTLEDSGLFFKWNGERHEW